MSVEKQQKHTVSLATINHLWVTEFPSFYISICNGGHHGKPIHLSSCLYRVLQLEFRHDQEVHQLVFNLMFYLDCICILY
jgi:hypothetical protein